MVYMLYENIFDYLLMLKINILLIILVGLNVLNEN